MKMHSSYVQSSVAAVAIVKPQFGRMASALMPAHLFLSNIFNIHMRCAANIYGKQQCVFGWVYPLIVDIVGSVLTDWYIFWNAKERHIAIVSVGPIVKKIWRIVRLCWEEKEARNERENTNVCTKPGNLFLTCLCLIQLREITSAVTSWLLKWPLISDKASWLHITTSHIIFDHRHYVVTKCLLLVAALTMNNIYRKSIPDTKHPPSINKSSY